MKGEVGEAFLFSLFLSPFLLPQSPKSKGSHEGGEGRGAVRRPGEEWGRKGGGSRLAGEERRKGFFPSAWGREERCGARLLWTRRAHIVRER